MKKIVLIMTFLINLFALATTNKYFDYANKLLNYRFNLNNINKIHTPCEPTPVITPFSTKKIYTKTISINLLSTFNDRAYFLIKEFLGDQLIKTYRKWVKVNDKIGNCKINKITFAKVILKCKNKLLIKTLNKKILRIKETQ